MTEDRKKIVKEYRRIEKDSVLVSNALDLMSEEIYDQLYRTSLLVPEDAQMEFFDNYMDKANIRRLLRDGDLYFTVEERDGFFCIDRLDSTKVSISTNNREDMIIAYYYTEDGFVKTYDPKNIIHVSLLNSNDEHFPYGKSYLETTRRLFEKEREQQERIDEFTYSLKNEHRVTREKIFTALKVPGSSIDASWDAETPDYGIGAYKLNVKSLSRDFIFAIGKADIMYEAKKKQHEENACRESRNVPTPVKDVIDEYIMNEVNSDMELNSERREIVEHTYSK